MDLKLVQNNAKNGLKCPKKTKTLSNKWRLWSWSIKIRLKTWPDFILVVLQGMTTCKGYFKQVINKQSVHYMNYENILLLASKWRLMSKQSARLELLVFLVSQQPNLLQANCGFNFTKLFSGHIFQSCKVV